jgi:6-phosphogluconolactonase
MTGPRIVVVADDRELGTRGAEYVCASLAQAIVDRGHAHLALTGGSTAIILYRAIASAGFRGRVDWRHVDLWWGDDRFVPLDHPDSNVLLVQDTLLAAQATDPAGIVIPEANVHPFPIPAAEAEGEGPDGCAARYSRELVSSVPLDEHGLPVFDLVLLGVGPDGHFLSCFPGSPLVDAPAPPICAGVPAPTTASPHVPRVTCSPRLTEIARDVLVLGSGAAKAAIMAAVLAGPRDVHRLPSQIAARAGATWMLDAPAAAGLPRPMRGAED